MKKQNSIQTTVHISTREKTKSAAFKKSIGVCLQSYTQMHVDAPFINAMISHRQSLISSIADVAQLAYCRLTYTKHSVLREVRAVGAP